MHDEDLAQTEPTLRWPDFGRTILQNNGSRCQSAQTVLAGQPPSAQVAGTRGTIYGSEGWGSSPPERGHEFPDHRPTPGPLLPLPVPLDLILAVLVLAGGPCRRCRGGKPGNPYHRGGDRPGWDGLSGGDTGMSYLVLGGLLVPRLLAGQH